MTRQLPETACCDCSAQMRRARSENQMYNKRGQPSGGHPVEVAGPEHARDGPLQLRRQPARQPVWQCAWRQQCTGELAWAQHSDIWCCRPCSAHYPVWSAVHWADLREEVSKKSARSCLTLDDGITAGMEQASKQAPCVFSVRIAASWAGLSAG